jgi:hypothetical protein
MAEVIHMNADEVPDIAVDWEMPLKDSYDAVKAMDSVISIREITPEEYTRARGSNLRVVHSGRLRSVEPGSDAFFRQFAASWRRTENFTARTVESDGVAHRPSPPGGLCEIWRNGERPERAAACSDRCLSKAIRSGSEWSWTVVEAGVTVVCCGRAAAASVFASISSMSAMRRSQMKTGTAFAAPVKGFDVYGV